VSVPGTGSLLSANQVPYQAGEVGQGDYQSPIDLARREGQPTNDPPGAFGEGNLDPTRGISERMEHDQKFIRIAARSDHCLPAFGLRQLGPIRPNRLLLPRLMIGAVLR
jgi:hypothetical protein